MTRRKALLAQHGHVPKGIPSGTWGRHRRSSFQIAGYAPATGPFLTVNGAAGKRRLIDSLSEMCACNSSLIFLAIFLGGPAGTIWGSNWIVKPSNTVPKKMSLIDSANQIYSIDNSIQFNTMLPFRRPRLVRFIKSSQNLHSIYPIQKGYSFKPRSYLNMREFLSQRNRRASQIVAMQCCC